MEQLRRIAAYLQQYVQNLDGDPMIPATPSYIKSGIKLLLDGKIMTVSEMRQEALEQFSVIIPWDLFPDDVVKKELGLC